jgi:pimeloyl-ACP methyl ester carboxylesterase
LTQIAPRSVGPHRGRAADPERAGTLDADGVAIRWESYGRGEPAIVFAPTWSIVHSRCWKQQIPDFARRHHVLTLDPRANGRSDRPADPAAYSEDHFASDVVAAMDAAEVDRAVLVGWSLGAQRTLIIAGEHRRRVHGLALIGPSLELGLAPTLEREAATRFTDDLGEDDGWARYNAHSWRRDYRGFAEFFFSQVFTEPHSTKQIEDCVGWASDTDAETLIAAEVAALDEARTTRLCAAVRCPVLVVHGDQDAIVPHAAGQPGSRAAELTGGRLLTFEGCGHGIPARDPVRLNLALREFVGTLGPSATDPR